MTQYLFIVQPCESHPQQLLSMSQSNSPVNSQPRDQTKIDQCLFLA